MAIAPSLAPRARAADARAAAPGRALRLRDGSALWLRSAGPESDAAADTADTAERVALEPGGAVVGRAAYTRVYGRRAVLSLEIDDAYAHRGLTELLLDELCRHAQSRGISALLARVPASDVTLLALLREHFAARQAREGRHVDVELPCRRPGGRAAA